MVEFFIVLAGVFGAIVGSFLNVVVRRLPRGESFSHPASHCPKCEHPIRPWDNVPVLSWVILRGKCRDCAEPISIRHPVVDLLTAIFFAGVIGWVFFGELSKPSIFGTVLVVAAFLYLAAVSVALGLIDLDTHTLPNAIVLPSYVVGAALLVSAATVDGEWHRLLTASIGAVALFGAYFAMALLYPGGMGYGDVKLAGVLGMYLGWLGYGTLAVGAFFPFLLGGIFAVGLLSGRKAGRKSAIPFGPWMLAGSWVGIFSGGPLSRWYLSLFGLA
jgi:leader peptidase (prepilin peptidase)/N-methyltransferase